MFLLKNFHLDAAVQRHSFNQGAGVLTHLLTINLSTNLPAALSPGLGLHLHGADGVLRRIEGPDGSLPKPDLVGEEPVSQQHSTATDLFLEVSHAT